MESLNQITIKNKSFGDYDGIKIYFTNSLYKKLSNEKTKEGRSIIDLFKVGMALRGLKHLIELIRKKNRNGKIIFTLGETKKEGNNYYINYNNYKKETGNKFFAMYRETGLDGASYFLNKNFPDEFEYDKARISEAQIKRIDKKLPEVIDEVTKTKKNKYILLDKATETLKKLKEERKKLKQEMKKIKELRNQSNILYYEEKLKELEERFKKNYKETSGKNSWQERIYKNTWLFGIQYSIFIEKEKVGFNNIPDYLFFSIDGFLDILEIKLPTYDVIIKDSSHSGSYRWSSEVNKAIGQVINYLHEIEIHQFEIKQNFERKYDLKGIYTIKPRAFILIGKKDNWSDEKKEAFRKLNYSLHGIEVLTYDDLIDKGKQIIDLYINDKFIN